MATCEYCGCVITQDMKVCESCGAPIPENAFATENRASQDTAYSGEAGYQLILVSCGSCARSQAEDLLEDLLSYDSAESGEILDNLPAEVARNLTREQASYLAQALTEYGMEVSVRDRDGYVDLSAAESDSVFDSSGNYIRRFAEILAMLTAANRVSRPMRWGQPIDRGHIFTSNCPPSQPPVHKRRKRSLLDRLFGSAEPSPRKPEPVSPMRGRPDSSLRKESDRGRRPAMTTGTMRGGAPSMGRNMDTGSRRPGGSSQNRNGLPPMGRNGGPGGGRPGGSRGPSRGHGPR